jgi:archaemetzincin
LIRRVLELVPIGDLDGQLLEWLMVEIENEFPVLRCIIGRQFIPRPQWRTGRGGQCSADEALDALMDWHAALGRSPDRHWLLALTELDLTAPGRDCVFGVAAIGGGCALVSLSRLRAGSGDKGEALALFRTRVWKEVVHELGHVVGLEHCDRRACVMIPSTDIEDTDAKPGDFCPACSRRLASRLEH